MTKKHSLVLDIGTTGIKAIIFDGENNLIEETYQRLNKRCPKKDRVEQAPEDYLSISKDLLAKVVKKSKLGEDDFLGMGITTQRETIVSWNGDSGKKLYPAIVWQDVRTMNDCARIGKDNKEMIRERTGLEVIPYFSGSKIAWLRDNVKRFEQMREKGKLRVGTVDTWLIWNLTEEKSYLTDYTNASRTLLFNIKKLAWDDKLFGIWGLDKSMMAEAVPSMSNFGTLDKSILGFSLPVSAVCGDQQASLFSARKLAPNQKNLTKATYGTGVFIMQDLGEEFILEDTFFTTLSAETTKKKPVFALEAKISDCASRVDPLVGKEELIVVLRALSEEVAVRVGKLKREPGILVADGGVIQDPRLVLVQAQALGIPVRPQVVHNGTALGVSQMIFASLE